MKEKYFKPFTEIEKFYTVDIITTSGEPNTDIPVPWGK